MIQTASPTHTPSTGSPEAGPQPQLRRLALRRGGPQPLRIVAFGSSTTAGYGASAPAHTYPEVMRRALAPSFPGGVVLVNQGISGETSREMDGRLHRVIEAEPDLVIWQTGSNDVTAPVPLETFEQLTRAGLARLRRTGADVVLMEQQFSRNLEAHPDMPAFLQALRAIAQSEGVPCFPRYDWMRGLCESGRFTMDNLSPDGTHMTDAGYAALGEAVASWLLARC